MKIVVATIGSRGDVQPYINLSQGLQAAGHDVTLATNPTLCPLAEQHGIRTAPVGSPVDMGLEGARLMEQSFDNMWIGLVRVMQLGGRLVEEAYPDGLAACRDADLVVTTDTGSGIAEAEKLGKPWVSVTLQPARVPTINTGPPTLASKVFGALIAPLMIAPTNRFRKKVGAPPVQDITTMLSSRLILLPVNPQVAPPDSRWPSQVRQTNYWYARPDPAWAPPPGLLDFLSAGEKPVVISLGVMGTAKARQSAQIVLDAVRQAGVRAILQGWSEVLAGTALPPTVYSAGPMPHSWLFDQAAAVVHHGGFGTTAAGLRSGVPSIIIPHIIDQYYWGQRIFELGVGPRFFSRPKLNPKRLAQSITQALTDTTMRRKAAQLGAAIRSEPDGVGQAIAWIEEAVSQPVSGPLPTGPAALDH